MAKRLTPTTSKMSKETEQQYTVWLLYCETGSLRKTLDAWDRVGQLLDETGTDFARRLGKKPSHTTIGTWSKKYRWVERKELRLVEILEALREKTKKIKREKLHKIAEGFERVTNKIIKRLREGEEPTINEWKQVWEMFQVELGKPTSRTALKEEQRPLTEEEKEEKKKLDAALKIIYEQQGKNKPPILDNRKQNKRRKRKAN